jgi:hypothetical protein
MESKGMGLLLLICFVITLLFLITFSDSDEKKIKGVSEGNAVQGFKKYDDF